MSGLKLRHARTIIKKALARGRELDLKPLSVCVLDPGGHTVAFEREDGASALRYKIAHGKAFGAIAVGMGSRAIFERAKQQAFFIQSVNALCDGALVPSPGGVLIRNKRGELIGAVGITGDTGDNDEICAIAGVEAAGFAADTGEKDAKFFAGGSGVGVSGGR
ncbi:MAG: heme-binding protein [Pseudomonadota bacterium]|nr:heme-binding protein [Pseudomonadota bacterium]